MEKCETREACSFFNNKLSNMPAIARNLRKTYCEQDKLKCARYMIKDKILKGYLPADDRSMDEIERGINNMYPNDFNKAESLIGMLTR